MSKAIDYCLVNGFKHRLIDYLEMFDAMTHDFWRGLNDFTKNDCLDDLSENLALLNKIKSDWFSYRFASLLGSPYNVENNSTRLIIEYDDIIKQILVSDLQGNTFFKRQISMVGFKEYRILSEMAKLIGSPFSTLETNHKGYRNKLFHETKHWSKTQQISPDLHLHHDDENTYLVNDHANKETLYISSIEKKDSSPGFQRPHIEQTAVDRVKSVDRLPKGFATEFIYDHFNKQALPLKSSNTQFTTGAAMWERLVSRALADGKHVYATSPDGVRKIHDYNKEFVMSTTRGEEPEYEDKHIVISHHPIEEFGNYQ